MNMQIITILLATIVTITCGIIVYTYDSDYYGADHIGTVPVTYVDMNTTDGTVYGITLGTETGATHVIIYVTGNTTEDAATYYHEAYHVYHWNEGDNDTAAEQYAVEHVAGYTAKVGT